MSVVEEREAETLTRRSVDMARQESFGLDRRVLVAHPGDRVGFFVRIYGPPRHVVSVVIRGIPPSVAEVMVSPSRAIAPYTAEISLTTRLTTRRGAEPGLYPFSVVINNLTTGQPIGVEKLGLLILPRELTLRHYTEAKRIYRYDGLGAQGVLWYLIAKVYRNGAGFMELKRAYELVRGGPVRKATIVKTLKRMIRKALIMKGEDGRYYPLVTRPEAAFSRIDRSRVRIQQPYIATRKGKERQGASTLEKLLHEPYVAKLAFRRAKKIASKHGSLVATYFLIYSLVGARETGFLLLWFNAMFVYCERKTGFCHYFYSQLLHHYFQLLGLKGGIVYRPSKEHLEAMKIASKYVRRYYGSHQSSRRIHYMLKKQGYIEYDNEVYNLEIIYYEDGDLGVRLWDNNMQEALYEENITDKPIAKREIKPAYPFEHIYEPNEETYFYKPGGIY